MVVRDRRIFVDEHPLKGQAISVRIHPALEQPPFVELSETREAMNGGVLSYPYDEIYVGETVTDVLIRYDIDPPRIHSGSQANLSLAYRARKNWPI